MISSPICLYDCDVPVDGSTAIVVSAVETVPDLRAPVRIEAMAGVIDGRPSWDQWEDMGRVGYATAAAMWDRTDLRPADVDVAELYDGFTIEAVWWLEAMGFCGHRGGRRLRRGGDRIALGGELPLNTWGGQLSGGRLHAAFGHTAEAVRQLRGEAGDRQVQDAEVAVVTNVGRLRGRRGAATTLVMLVGIHDGGEHDGGTSGARRGQGGRSSPGRARRPGPGIGTGKATRGGARPRGGERPARRPPPGARRGDPADDRGRGRQGRGLRRPTSPRRPIARRMVAGRRRRLRDARHPGQQHRTGVARHGRRHDRGGLGPGARHQPAHRVPRVQVRGAGHGGGRAPARSSTSRRSRRCAATAPSPIRRPRAG